MLFSKSGHAFEILVLPLNNEFLNYAKHLSRKDHSQAEDVIQDSLIKAMAAWPDWEPSHPDQVEISCKAWMFRIVSNRFMDVCSSNKRRLRLTLEATSDVTSHFYDGRDQTVNEEMSMALAPMVRRAVDRLDPDRRAIIEGVYLHGETSKELSERLKVNRETVRSRLERGLKKLRPLVQSYVTESCPWVRGGRKALRRAGINAAWFEPSQVEESDPGSVQGVMGEDDASDLLDAECFLDSATAG
jgi:RNA polymerase sigma factor (sigma-70 family)